MSKDIVNAALLGGDYSADERLAAFLVNLSDRFAERGYSPVAPAPDDAALGHRQLSAARARKPSVACCAASRTTACCAVDRREVDLPQHDAPDGTWRAACCAQ
jgi:hypothetical protein